MNKLLLLVVSIFVVMSCTSEPKSADATTSTPKKEEAAKPVDPSILASPSTLLNMTTGYWHIAGAFHKDIEGGKEGNKGKWLKFHKDMTFTSGQKEKDLFKGYWRYDDEHELITIRSENAKTYFLNEWKVQMSGDVILLIGNTPQNLRGGQIKLVRVDEKVIDYNL